jgi:D-sedoheptulose 7-phosphate isomerase
MPAHPAESPAPDARENGGETGLARFLQSEAAEHREAFEALLPGLAVPFGRTLGLWEATVRAGGKLLFFGNGGSAADAQHLATELVVRYQAERPAIGAIALATDTSVLTASANDLGYEHVFSRQIEALGRPGDVAVGISTSGRSPNVLAGLAAARARSLRTVGLTGAESAAMQGLCDVLLRVPSRITARIQEMHIFLGHLLCKALEQRLAGSVSAGVVGAEAAAGVPDPGTAARGAGR